MSINLNDLTSKEKALIIEALRYRAKKVRASAVYKLEESEIKTVIQQATDLDAVRHKIEVSSHA